MESKIQIKRGLKEKLPNLAVGEPAFTTDTKEFFIGAGTGNVEFAKQEDLKIANAQLSDMDYQTAGGTATVIILTMQTLRNGYSKTFIASANNGGATTTINGKKLYKPNTTTSPNLIAGKAYAVWYNATGDCFFIKASAQRNTIAAHVLAGDTFSNDNDTALVGTMPNNGPISQVLAINGTYTIPAGYHNGSGKVTQSIPTKAAVTIAPSTVNQTIASGQYLSGDQTILGDKNLLAANIVNNTTIFGVKGNALKMNYKSGTAVSEEYSATYDSTIVNLSDALPFVPDLVLISWDGCYEGGGAMVNFTGFGPTYVVWEVGDRWRVGTAAPGAVTRDYTELFGSFDYAHIPLSYSGRSYPNKTVNYRAYKFS